MNPERIHLSSMVECCICLQKHFDLKEHMKESHQVQLYHNLPKHCRYLTFKSRLYSYSSHIVPPSFLAEAGFFKTEHGDIVECFWCGLRLRQWLACDDPWEEHRKYNPQCYFYKKCSPLGLDEIDESWV